MIFAGAKSAAKARVPCNRLRERTRASAFGCLSREENPAASITICSPGTLTAFIAIICLDILPALSPD